MITTHIFFSFFFFFNSLLFFLLPFFLLNCFLVYVYPFPNEGFSWMFSLDWCSIGYIFTSFFSFRSPLFLLSFVFSFLFLLFFIYFFLFKLLPIFPNKYPFIIHFIYFRGGRWMDRSLVLRSGVFDGFHVLDKLQGLG